MRAKIFAVEREFLALPRREDEVERLFEAFAALFLRDVETDVIEREGTPSDPEFEPSVAEDVHNRRFLGDLYRMVQGQQHHRSPQANAGRALRGRRQHHQRVGEDRKGATEVELAEPCRVKAELVAELDLGEDVLVALLLGKPARARQLVKEAETHLFSPSWFFAVALADPITWQDGERQPGDPIPKLGELR